MRTLKDKRLDPATATVRPVRQREKDQPHSEPGDARALPPPPSLAVPARPAPRREAGPPARSASLLQLRLSLFRPRPCHQPWACGCAPWRAHFCKVLGGRGLTHLRASAARREGRGEGASRPGAGGPRGLAPPPGAAAPARGRLAGPGRRRGPRARAVLRSCHLPCVRPPSPLLAGVAKSRWLLFKRGSQRNTVRLLFPKTQWGPCVGCGLLEDCWGVRAAPHRALMGFLPERPRIGRTSGWGRKKAATCTPDLGRPGGLCLYV